MRTRVTPRHNFVVVKRPTSVRNLQRGIAFNLDWYLYMNITSGVLHCESIEQEIASVNEQTRPAAHVQVTSGLASTLASLASQASRHA